MLIEMYERIENYVHEILKPICPSQGRSDAKIYTPYPRVQPQWLDKF